MKVKFRFTWLLLEAYKKDGCVEPVQLIHFLGGSRINCIRVRYNEAGLLGEVEEHLKITIEQTSTKMEIPVNEFDGKVRFKLRNNTYHAQFKALRGGI